MRIISIINQKGGCGKTTSAINLSAIFARRGLRTLLVDMDPQSHCAVGLGIPEGRLDYDIGDALLHGDSRRFDFSRIVWPAARNLDLAPSRMRLAGLEARAGGLADKPDREQRLAMVLGKLKNQYDVVCIDCSPSIGLLTFNALAAANMVLVPVETGFFSLQGATRQVNTVRSVSKRMGAPLPVWILPTIHDESSAIAGDLLEELKRRFGQRVMPTIIRRDPRLREAAGFGQPIVDFDANSIGAADYTAAANWLLEQVLTPGAIEDDGPIEDADLYTTPPIAVEPELVEQPVVEITDGLRQAASIRQELIASIQQPEVLLNRAEELAQRARSLSAKASSNRGVAIAETDARKQTETQLSRPTETLEPSPRLAGFQTLTILEPQRPTMSESHVSLLGVRSTRQGVLFVQPASMGERISIAGDFNSWSATNAIMKLNHTLGVYELTLKLPPGKHQYRLVVDGAWMADAHNRNRQTNPFGEQNSVIEVP